MENQSTIEKDNKATLYHRRDYKVFKDNDLIQKSRYSLTAQESKILLYTISRLKKDDTTRQFTFNVRAICEMLGLEFNGKNYKNIRDTLQQLGSRTFWIKKDEKLILCRWVEKVIIDTKSLNVDIILDNDLMPYLTYICDFNFTSYVLENILPMKSKYSIRLYEILKSYAYIGTYKVDLEELKSTIQSADYKQYNKFKTKVIDYAVNEINLYTDIQVTYKPIKDCRKVVAIQFDIKNLNIVDSIDNMVRRKDMLEKEKDTDEYYINY